MLQTQTTWCDWFSSVWRKPFSHFEPSRFWVSNVGITSYLLAYALASGITVLLKILSRLVIYKELVNRNI